MQRGQELMQNLRQEITQVRNPTSIESPMNQVESRSIPSSLDPRDQRRVQIGNDVAREFKNFTITKFNGRGTNITENWIIEIEAYFAIKGFSS